MTKEGFGSRILNKLSWFGKIPEYNVLLLGETGVGKSTTINAWANFMHYRTFEEAKHGDFERMIPVKFKLPDPVTKEPIDIECGLNDDDDNAKNEEFNEDGYSVTQMPSAYAFKFKDKVLRIIDTPGIGDTRGGTVDRENIDRILEYLNNYKELHAIVILFEANQTYSTGSRCILELFNHLHKDATKNLIFCFTFSQNTDFRAGEGYHTVKSSLENYFPEVEFELKSGENCFFIDNDSFRFLTAIKQDYLFDLSQERSYRLSWDKSAEQSNKMWDRITRESEPHNLTHTISQNNARKILPMAEPLVRLQTTIEDNIDHIRTQKGLLQKQTSTKADLELQLNIEVDSLVSEPLEHPRTVCTDPKCIELVDSGQGNVQIHYKTKCHPHCSLKDVGVNTPGHPLLRRCAAMGFTGQCVVCGCRWEKHQHITLRFKKVKIQAFDENTKNLIKSAETVIEGIKAAIQAFGDRIEAYQEEYEVIQKVCSKFAYILVQNSTTPFNRFIEPYLDLQMDEEMTKIGVNPNHPKDRLKSLKKMKHLHQEQVEAIKKAIENGEQEAIKLEDIYEHKKKLFKLKLTGNQLKQMIETASLSRNNDIKRIPEKTLDLTSIGFSTVTYESNSSRLNNNKTNYVEKLTTNQVNILSIIQQLKVEFKGISMVDKSQQVTSSVQNINYYLENASNVILNSKSQASIGHVTMTKQTTQNSCTDDVKLLIVTLRKFCSDFSSALNTGKIEETIVLLESAVTSKAIFDNQDKTNSAIRTDLFPSEVENSIDTRPVTEESIDSVGRMGGLIMIALVIGLSFIWSKQSLGRQ